MDLQTEIHNRTAGEIVKAIVKPPLDAGGQFTDVLVILESVIFGVMLMAVKLGGDDKVLDEVVLHVKERLAKARLGGIEPSGTA
jgi:hypothetical protein